MLDNFEVSLGWRYEDFSSYGSNDVFKVGARWDITDSLAIRGTWGEVRLRVSLTSIRAKLIRSRPTLIHPTGLLRRMAPLLRAVRNNPNSWTLRYSPKSAATPS